VSSPAKQCLWSASFRKLNRWKSEYIKLELQDVGEKIQGADFCRCSHGYCLLGQQKNLVIGIVEEKF